MNEIFRNPNKEKFFLIAGPCVIENEEITFLIARRLKDLTTKLGSHLYLRLPLTKQIEVQSIHSEGLVSKKDSKYFKLLKMNYPLKY